MPSLIKNDCLIGYSGFVGTSLLKQASFEALFRSTDIGDIEGRVFDTVICAAAPAQKWLANREPEADWNAIAELINHLKTICCRSFILISTVDVFQHPLGVDEQAAVEEAGLHPYGLHRRRLEQFAQSHFDHCLIVRLPGLVGPGLRKNVLFDFLNDNNLDAIDCRGVFQFYPMVNLWYDIQIARHAGLKLLHLTAQPLSVADVAGQGFGKPFKRMLGLPPPAYDMRTCYGQVFGVEGDYQYRRHEALQAIRTYAQSEPRTLKALQEARA